MQEAWVLMLYPEERRVKASQVRAWLSDAIANNEIHDSRLDFASVDSVDLEYACPVLEDTGKFTFAKPKFW